MYNSNFLHEEKILSIFKRLRRLGLDQFPELEINVSPAQVMLLEQIAANPGCGVQEIAMNLGLTTPTVSVGVSKLEKCELVKRLSDPADKRSVQLFLSSEGQSYFEEFNTARQNKLHLLFKGLDETEQETLISLLDRALIYAEENINTNQTKL